MEQLTGQRSKWATACYRLSDVEAVFFLKNKCSTWNILQCKILPHLCGDFLTFAPSFVAVPVLGRLFLF